MVCSFFELETVWAQLKEAPSGRTIARRCASKLVFVRRPHGRKPRADPKQGSHGESMLIVYSGKAEILFNEYVVSILWPGKAFGQAQMLGLQRCYLCIVFRWGIGPGRSWRRPKFGVGGVWPISGGSVFSFSRLAAPPTQIVGGHRARKSTPARRSTLDTKWVDMADLGK